MPGIAHLAAEAPPWCTIGNTLEASGVRALVVLLEFLENLKHASKAFGGKYVWCCISIHDLLGSLFNAVGIRNGAGAFLPARTTDIAKLGTAAASTTS
jgi:hypothetical protein